MNLDQLHYIVEVAKTKSLLAAANNLFVTQSAISQSISSLESELGVKLFNRTRSGTFPTKEGTSVIKKVLKVERILQEIKDEINQSEISGGKLCAATIPGVMSPMVRTVSNLKKDYPSVQFEIIEKASEEIISLVRQNKVDIGLICCNQELLKSEHGLHFEPLWQGKIVVGVWKNSPLALKEVVNPEELLKYSFILFNEGYLHEFVTNFTEKIGQLHILFSSNNETAIANALKEGLAITLGYDISFYDNPYYLSGDLIMIEIARFEQKPITLGWICPEKNKASLLSKKFINRFSHEIQTTYL